MGVRGWQFTAVTLAVGLVATIWLWQNQYGWSSAVLGSFADYLTAVLIAGTLAYTMNLARQQSAKEAEEIERTAARYRLAEANRLAVWPLKMLSKLSEPLSWAIAIQNLSDTPVPQWRCEVTHEPTGAHEVYTSDEHGGLAPNSQFPLVFAIGHLPIHGPANIDIVMTWTDALGGSWIRRGSSSAIAKPS